MNDQLEKMVRQNYDQLRITEKLYLYCRACDRLDEELMESVFWPDAIATHGEYHGPAEGFWRGALFFLSGLQSALHYAINPVVEIDGDQAYQEAIFLAWHRVQKGQMSPDKKFLKNAGPAASNEEDLFTGFPGHDLTKDEDAVFHGRYVNRFERRGDEWRILKHVCFVEWAHWREASERAPIDMMHLSQRDRRDPVYWRKENWPE